MQPGSKQRPSDVDMWANEEWGFVAVALNKFCQLGEIRFCKCSIYPPGFKGCSSEKQTVLPALHMSALFKELPNAVRRFHLLFYMYFKLYIYIYIKACCSRWFWNCFFFPVSSRSAQTIPLGAFELFSFPLQLCFKYLQHTCKTVHLSSVIFTQGKKSSLPSAAFLSSDFFGGDAWTTAGLWVAFPTFRGFMEQLPSYLT